MSEKNNKQPVQPPAPEKKIVHNSNEIIANWVTVNANDENMIKKSLDKGDLSNNHVKIDKL